MNTDINPLIKKFMLIESSQIPLTPIPYEDIKKTIINPITKKPYKGIILFGCFADLSNTNPNINNRYYDIPTYLEFVKNLRKQIFTPKGVYGELEHPKGYNIDLKNASHKLIDIWWDEDQKKVFGYVLILNNTVNGKIAKDIIESGGQLAISARAAGEENKRSDGSFDCKVKLLTTYDLVYHPGFSSAVLQFKELNESQKLIQNKSINKNGFSCIIYEEDFNKIDNKFTEYINLNENSYCFYEWFMKNLFESKNNQQKEDQKIIQKNQASDQSEIQNKLSKNTEKDLKQSESKQSESKQNFFDQVKQQTSLFQLEAMVDASKGGDFNSDHRENISPYDENSSNRHIKNKFALKPKYYNSPNVRKKPGAGSVYDNSAGFIKQTKQMRDNSGVEGTGKETNEIADANSNVNNNYFHGIDINGFTY